MNNSVAEMNSYPLQVTVPVATEILVSGSHVLPGYGAGSQTEDGNKIFHAVIISYRYGTAWEIAAI